MTPEERNLLDDLFQRLRQAEGQPRDADAERHIREVVQAQPAAPYYMAQSLLVQQHALSAAQQRIEDLERQLKDAQERAKAPSGGGVGSFLGNALGLGRREEPRPAPQPAPSGPWGAAPAQPAYPPQGGPRPGPWGGAPAGFPQQAGYPQQGAYPQPGYPGAGGYPPQPGRGSFMGGAMQTAAGVAGGMLAASAISSLLHGSGSPFGAADAAHQAPVSHTPADTGDPVLNNDTGFLPPAAQQTGYQETAYEPDNSDYTVDDADVGGDDNWA